ncbi:Poly(A) RNA polymerase GLD2, partial [Fasciolopsis buskii]
FIRNLNLIRAKVPILKFRDTLAGVDCDLNVNNVVGIYNTHLLAMYTKIDWRVRPLGMFVKYWAQRMDIHDGSRGRLSTYPLLLMLIHYLQAACTPPILPNLQAKFPKIFNYACPLAELDMRLELPWAELRSNNPASLAELFVGFIHYYTNEFDFSRWAVSVRNGAPLPIDMAIRRLPPHEQAHTARSFKVFVEGRTPGQVSSIMTAPSRGLQMVSNGPLIPPGAPLSFASAQPNISSSLYMEALSLTIWQFYTRTRQSKAKYAKKVHLRNALLEVVSGVFKHAGLFIVGSSMNGFGSDQSDMDMCLTVTSQYLQQKKEAFAVLSQLLPPLRNCSKYNI